MAHKVCLKKKKIHYQFYSVETVGHNKPINHHRLGILYADGKSLQMNIPHINTGHWKPSHPDEGNPQIGMEVW